MKELLDGYPYTNGTPIKQSALKQFMEWNSKMKIFQLDELLTADKINKVCEILRRVN